MNKTLTIGMDETGVGDYYTSLVCAAVSLNADQTEELKKMGVKDSKKLSPKQIKFFAFKIKKMTNYQIRHLTPAGYNKLNSIFDNTHVLKTFLHWNALNALIEQIGTNKKHHIILDEYVSAKNIEKYLIQLRESPLDFPKNDFDVHLEKKADQNYIAVAAASIIARDFMIYKLEVQRKKWKTDFPLGCSPKVIEIGKIFVKNHGANNLKNVAKISFKTTSAII